MNIPDGIFQVGIDILKTIRDVATKTILAQTGDVRNETAETDNVEWWQHIGFLSRPSKPTAKQAACQGVVIRRGDHDACIASRDLRGQELAGSLEDGETCIYAPGVDGLAQGRILLKANGSVSLYTAQGNVAGGSSVTMQVNADGSVIMASQYGAITISSAGIKMATENGGFQIGTDGKMAMIGPECALNVGALSLGANATMPVVWGPLGISGVGSLSVKVAV